VDIGPSDGGSEDAGLPPELLLKEGLAKVRAQKMLFLSKG
jgi:hypothetical protein